ncbi:MAG: tyrosine-type recombinase/integrase, partial [Deltaproteobacteria bacterium]|nr:tyrosine-type recombinase/integrase [Deltaproteobacteria bacterium]
WRGSDGVRVRKSFRLIADAERHLRQIKDSVESGAYVTPKTIPMFHQVAEEWFKEKTLGVGCKRAPRPVTLQGWRIHLDRHLLPHLGEKRLDAISERTMARVRDVLVESGLGAKTINKVLVTAASVFRLAVKRRYCHRNSAAETDRLGLADIEITEESGSQRNGFVSESDVLAPEEMKSLAKQCAEDLYGTLILTGLLTGARHDELLALKWPSVELDAGKIWIRESLTWARLKGEEFTERWRFYPPKTRAGQRCIPIPPEIVSRLKAWKLKCPPTKLDLVFPGPDGNPMRRHHSLRVGLHPLLRRAGLRQVHFHSLRHSFASAMILAGSPITEVAGVLGHSSPQTTLSIYSHWFQSVQTSSVSKLAANILEGEEEKRQVSGG